MGEGHLPVLVDEVLASLDVRTGSSIADCTVGGGGHADRLLEASSPDGRLLGLDADRAAIEEAHRVLAQYGDRVVLRQANFESLYDVAREDSFIPLDGVLFDLGLSSYQLADPSRGFSFTADAPPDMRFDEDHWHIGPGAHRPDRRSESSPESSRRLVRNAVRAASRRRSWRRAGRAPDDHRRPGCRGRQRPPRPAGADAGRIHPATRTFQALRIAVNRELEVLPPALAGALAALRPGGRLAVISYHSGEDRIVKRFMARESRDCVEDPLPPVCTCGHRAQLRAIHRRGITAERRRGPPQSPRAQRTPAGGRTSSPRLAGQPHDGGSPA